MEEMMETCPEKVMERFHIDDPSLRGQELIEAACRGRGWLLKGGECDFDRASRVILDEFRGGKLGRITLEKVPDENAGEASPSANPIGCEEEAAPAGDSNPSEEVNP